MAVIRIDLFGRMRIVVDDRPVFVGIPQTKSLELFAYLLIHRRRMHPREILATLLWPDLRPIQARKNLRKVLYTLQRLLGHVVGPHPPLLVIEQDWIAINPHVELQLDIAMFEQVYQLSQQKAGGTLDAQTAQQISSAVQLYEGELLTGLYSDWCLLEREQLENMYFELLRTLMLHAESEHAYEQAITYGHQILRQDRANERTYCDLMRLYYLSGNRTAALHQYEHCVDALADELGVKPSKHTRLLYEQICQDDFGLTPKPEPSDARPKPDPQTTAHMHLQQVHEELQTILKQVQDEIHRVDRLLQS